MNSHLVTYEAWQGLFLVTNRVELSPHLVSGIAAIIFETNCCVPPIGSSEICQLDMIYTYQVVLVAV